MVKITDYKLRESLEKKPFFVLILQSGIEIITSANGNSYATVRKVSLPTTFDEATCQSLIGTELPGSIKKVDCEAYDYTIPETGEIITLTHRFEYVDIEELTQKEFVKIYKNSTNGVNAEMA